MSSEYRFYATRSGLVPMERFSRSDHQQRWWRTQTASVVERSWSDDKMAFLRLLTGLSGSIRFLENRYFAVLTGREDSTESLKDLYFDSL